MVPLLLFDIDLTLIRSQGAGRAAVDLAFLRLFGVDQASAGMRFDGRTDHAIFHEIIDRHGLGGSPAAYERVTSVYLQELGGALAARPGEILPGVIGLLDALAVEGVPLGLATGNLRRGAEQKLRHYGLWERFKGGGFGDTSSVRAEVVAAGIVELAAAAGCDPDPLRTLVIGDTPLDVEAAHAAGAKAFAVATGTWGADELRASGAEHVVDDLSDLEACLRVLLDR